MAERERRRHLKAVVGVSAAARTLIDAAFETGSQTYEQIVEAVRQATGETIGKSSLARYWREWRVQQRAREAREIALAQLADLRRLPTDKLDEVIEQLLRTNAYESLAQAEAGDIDPGKAMRALDARQRTRMSREKLQIDQEKQRVADERLALDKARLELERERKLAIDKPALFLEFFKGMVETLVQADPAAAEVLNRHFDRLMARVKGAAA